MRPAPVGPAHRAPCARRRRLRGPASRRPGAPAPQHSAWSPAGTTGAGAAAAGAAPGPQCPRHGADGCRPLQRAAARSPRRTTAVRAGPDGPGRGPRRGGGEGCGSGPLSAAEQSGGLAPGGRGRHLAGTERSYKARGAPPARARVCPPGWGGSLLLKGPRGAHFWGAPATRGTRRWNLRPSRLLRLPSGLSFQRPPRPPAPLWGFPQSNSGFR